MSLRSFVWQRSPPALLYLYAKLTLLRNEDRVFLKNDVVGHIASSGRKTVLNIGVHYYTNDLHRAMIAAGLDLYTADIDRNKRKWGIPSKHAVAEAASLDGVFPERAFDVVLLFGVLGYGIDTAQDRRRTFTALRRIMRDDAILMIAWDEAMSDDPLADPAFSDLFARHPDFLGGKRHRVGSGLIDGHGRPSFKIFDFVARTPDAAAS